MLVAGFFANRERSLERRPIPRGRVLDAGRLQSPWCAGGRGEAGVLPLRSGPASNKPCMFEERIESCLDLADGASQGFLNCVRLGLVRLHGLESRSMSYSV